MLFIGSYTRKINVDTRNWIGWSEMVQSWMYTHTCICICIQSTCSNAERKHIIYLLNTLVLIDYNRVWAKEITDDDANRRKLKRTESLWTSKTSECANSIPPRQNEVLCTQKTRVWSKRESTSDLTHVKCERSDLNKKIFHVTYTTRITCNV